MARPRRDRGNRAEAVNVSTQAERTPPEPAAETHESNRIGRLLKVIGPGLITGASDDDPSGIATYATVGASLGYATLWTAPVTFPLMSAVQYICAKIGMVSGLGIAGVLRRNYPRWLLYLVVTPLVVANTINAGTDIGAIAAAINLLVPVPIAALIVPVALTILALQIFCSYRVIARTFKWLTLALLAYVGAAFFAQPNMGEVLRNTVVPTVRWEPQFLAALVAILGTTISPYLFFWEASEEVEEEESLGRTQLRQRQGATDDELRSRAWDIDIGMLLCNVIFYFVILTSAATLHQAGRIEIESAADAAEALRPLAGDAAAILFSLGIIGSGFLAVPVLTGSAAYAASEAFGWRYGLDRRPSRAKQFYGVIAVATLVGMEINFLGFSPIHALFWTAVINGFLAPPLLVIIMLISNNRRVMGARTNGTVVNILGWATTAVMSAAAIALLVTWRND